MTALDQIIQPTPERLLAANDNFVVDKATGATRMQDSPIDRLHRIGSLTDHELAAAKRYYVDFYAAGLAPLGAIDYERPNVDGTKPSTVSDMRMGALARWNSAKDAMGAFFSVVVDAVVLHERSVEDAGREACGRKSGKQAQAVGMDRLTEGLRILAKRYGIG